MPQGPQDPIEEGVMSNVEIRVAFQNLTQIVTTQSQVVITQAQAMTAQANRGVGPQVNPNASNPAFRI